jgi:hypothetical protein
MHVFSSRHTRFAALPLTAALALAAFWPADAVRAEGLPKASVVATNSETGEVDRAPGVFTISLSEKATKPVTVLYALKGTAVNGENYVRLSGMK